MTKPTTLALNSEVKKAVRDALSVIYDLDFRKVSLFIGKKKNVCVTVTVIRHGKMTTRSVRLWNVYSLTRVYGWPTK